MKQSGDRRPDRRAAGAIHLAGRADSPGGSRSGWRPRFVADRSRDRVVRVTAESLTRLLGLAGEALVQSHRLSPLVDSLWRLKGKQTRLLKSLQVLEDHILNHRETRLAAADRERLARAKAQASQGLQKLGETVEAIEEFARQSEDLSSRLHHEVLASRMRPLADGIRGFPRLVRDLARELGKQARFEVVGETTGVDRDILDRLESPLNHLIRNAVDHGLEMPEERRAAGKKAVGTIRLEARHRAGMLQIILSDDGRGIDLERLRAKVVERELTTAAIADAAQRGGIARVPVPSRVLDQGTRDRSLRPRRWARRGSQHGASSRRLGPRERPPRQGNSVRAPVADHGLGDPCPLGRDCRRAVRVSR